MQNSHARNLISLVSNNTTSVSLFDHFYNEKVLCYSSCRPQESKKPIESKKSNIFTVTVERVDSLEKTLNFMEMHMEQLSHVVNEKIKKIKQLELRVKYLENWVFLINRERTSPKKNRYTIS